MEAIKDDQYGLLVAKYQLLEMARLNRVLKERGIADKGLRYRICSEYFFPNGLFLDADGDSMAWQGKRLHPILCFAERHPFTTEKSTPIRAIHWDNHANLYWQTEASLDLLFNKMNEDVGDLEKELDLKL